MKLSIITCVLPAVPPAATLDAADPPAKGFPATSPLSQIAYLYQPTDGVIADIIPFYWQGRFHLAHLQLKLGQKGWDWAQLETRDFTDYEHTGVAIAGGGTDDAQDRDIFTGSVFEKDGVLHAFYCGHNDLLAKQKLPDQRMLLATSTDGIVWTKDEVFRLSPEGDTRYRGPGDRVTLKVVLDGNAAVACVNDDVCLSTRMYDRREDTFGIWSDTVGSELSNVVLQTGGTAR